MRSKLQNAMSKESAMSMLGLNIISEGKVKKLKQATDYSEEDLTVAFRDTCSLMGERVFVILLI